MNKLKQGFLGLAILSMAACGLTSKNENAALTVQEFNAKMSETSDYTLLDVRTPEEYTTGYLAGAQNMDVNSADFASNAVKLNKENAVLVYCKSGGRSKTAADQLRVLGYEVFDLAGGITSWRAKDLPIEQVKKEDKESFTLARYKKETTENAFVLVDFHATWCGPCKMMAPHIEAMKEKYGDKLTVLKVDTDKSVQVSEHFKINAIPLVKLYKNAKEVYDKTGYHSAEELDALLAKNI